MSFKLRLAIAHAAPAVPALLQPRQPMPANLVRKAGIM